MRRPLMMMFTLCFALHQGVRAASGIALVQLHASAAGSQTSMHTSLINSANAKCDDDIHFYRHGDCHAFETLKLCEERRHQITWLASYPGSGNTWTRTLIEHATGIITGSMYEDETLMDASLLGEGHIDPGEVVVVKTHSANFSLMPATGSRAIVLVRSPLHAALSRTQILVVDKLGENKHTAEVPYEELRQLFDRYRETALDSWRVFYNFWTKFPGDILLLKYEDLENDSRGILTRQVLPFLGFNVSFAGSRLDCLDAMQSQAIQRNHSYTFNFTDEDRQIAQRILGDLPATFGYEI